MDDKKEAPFQRDLRHAILYLFLAVGICWSAYEDTLLRLILWGQEVRFLWFDYIFMLFSFGAMVWLSLIYYAVHKKTKRFAWRYLVLLAFFMLWPFVTIWA